MDNEEIKVSENPKWLETIVTVPEEAPELDAQGNLHVRRGRREKVIPASELGIEALLSAGTGTGNIGMANAADAGQTDSSRNGGAL